MIDVNNILLKRYTSLFATLSVPAWAVNAPANTPALYVVYYPSTVIKDEVKTCQGAVVYMTVSIYSDNLITAKFSDLNNVANEIFNKINPEPGSKLNLTGAYNWDTEVAADRMQTNYLGAIAQAQRNIIFSHKITF